MNSFRPSPPETSHCKVSSFKFRFQYLETFLKLRVQYLCQEDVGLSLERTDTRRYRVQETELSATSLDSSRVDPSRSITHCLQGVTMATMSDAEMIAGVRAGRGDAYQQLGSMASSPGAPVVLPLSL